MAVDEIAGMIEGLSFPEKLELMERLGSSIRRGGGGNRSTAKASKYYTPSNTPTGALGPLAWSAYVNHVKKTHPEKFKKIKHGYINIDIAKKMRSEDPEGYKRFTENWKASHRNSGAAGGGTPSAGPTELNTLATSITKEIPGITYDEARKIALKRIARLKAYSTPGGVSIPSHMPSPPPATRWNLPKYHYEMPWIVQIFVDGTKYWHDPESNGLWEVTGDNAATGTGAWVGYLQPGNNEEPIRYTEDFGIGGKSRKTRRARKNRK